ncbi:MAG: hypothetical protein IJU68_00815 [Bacteroidales bacterium]|nr:hypothetical protein [Bacteroidales bacterium]
MKFLRILFVFILFIGCKETLPDKVILPESVTSASKRPIILDYICLNGCVECQLLDAHRWIRRNNELALMGDDYRASIICILAFKNKSDASITNRYDFLKSVNNNNVSYIYSNNFIQHFYKVNSFKPSRSFTCLLEPDGDVIYKGGNPKKDIDIFKHYSKAIFQYNIKAGWTFCRMES